MVEKIKCPNCGTEIDVHNIISHKLEDEIREKIQLQFAKDQEAFIQKIEQLNKDQAEFEAKKKQTNELFQERLNKQLKIQLAEEELKLKAKLSEEQSEQFKALQKELNEKSEKIKEFNKNKAEIEKLKREKAELKDQIEAESQAFLNKTLLLEREKIRKLEEEKHELKFKELEKQLSDQKKLTEEMSRKQKQGSMQLQGEVQELAIEEWLTAKFPLDTIEEIKKGARGGDCIQIVHTRTRQNCGKIYYESKRTKEFQPNWIEKFKEDMQEKNADVGILVTEAMPNGVERLTNIDGVWVCTFEEFKGLSAVIRESVIQLSLAVASQENKGDKMVMLYEYLTSKNFKMQIEAIVDGFSNMKQALDSEKRAMQRIWKEREKQIDKVITNTIDMYGSIRGIAGNEIATIQLLELPDGEQ